MRSLSDVPVAPLFQTLSLGRLSPRNSNRKRALCKSEPSPEIPPLVGSCSEFDEDVIVELNQQNDRAAKHGFVTGQMVVLAFPLMLVQASMTFRYVDENALGDSLPIILFTILLFAASSFVFQTMMKPKPQKSADAPRQLN